MINLSALLNLTRSRILILLPDSLLLADWLLLCFLILALPLSNSVVLQETLSQLFGLQQKHQFLLRVSIFLIKLMTSLPYPVLFRCNPLLVKQFPQPLYLQRPGDHIHF